MNSLDVGVDKGLSKTNLAVVRADESIILEARIDHVDPTSKLLMTDDQLLHQIAQHLDPVATYPLYLFGSHVGTTRSFVDGLRACGLAVKVLEAFNDTHGHYGLTTMPGNAVTVACGSHWNAMYYDDANNVICSGSAWSCAGRGSTAPRTDLLWHVWASDACRVQITCSLLV